MSYCVQIYDYFRNVLHIGRLFKALFRCLRLYNCAFFATVVPIKHVTVVFLIYVAVRTVGCGVLYSKVISSGGAILKSVYSVRDVDLQSGTLTDDRALLHLADLECLGRVARERLWEVNP